MDKDPQKEKAALESYATERALMNSPYDESYDQKTEADPRFKILFQLAFGGCVKLLFYNPSVGSPNFA